MRSQSRGWRWTAAASQPERGGRAAVVPAGLEPRPRAVPRGSSPQADPAMGARGLRAQAGIGHRMRLPQGAATRRPPAWGGKAGPSRARPPGSLLGWEGVSRPVSRGPCFPDGGRRALVPALPSLWAPGLHASPAPVPDRPTLVTRLSGDAAEGSRRGLRGNFSSFTCADGSAGPPLVSVSDPDPKSQAVSQLLRGRSPCSRRRGTNLEVILLKIWGNFSPKGNSSFFITN